MSHFVYPGYFEEFCTPRSTKFAHLGKVTRPFQILSGGYQLVFKNGQWSQIYGSAEKRRRFRKEDLRDHRSAFRGRGLSRPVRVRRWGRVLATY